MRVWRVRVRRDNGDSLNWVSAAVRSGGMLPVWGIVLTPLIMRLPRLRDEPCAVTATVVCGLLTLALLPATFFHPRQRAPPDWTNGRHPVLPPHTPPQNAATTHQPPLRPPRPPHA